MGYASYDTDAFTRAHVRVLDARRHTTDLRLEGVHCAACVWLVERLGRVVDGVIEVGHAPATVPHDGRLAREDANGSGARVRVGPSDRSDRGER